MKASRRNIRNAALKAQKAAQGPRVSSYARKEAARRIEAKERADDDRR